MSRLGLRPKFRPFGVIWSCLALSGIHKAPKCSETRPDLVFGIKIVLHIVDWDLYQLWRWPWPILAPWNTWSLMEPALFPNLRLLSWQELTNCSARVRLYGPSDSKEMRTRSSKKSRISPRKPCPKMASEATQKCITRLPNSCKKRTQQNGPPAHLHGLKLLSLQLVNGECPVNHCTLCLSARLCPWYSKFGDHRFRGILLKSTIRNCAECYYKEG